MAGSQPSSCKMHFGNPLSADQEYEAGFTCNASGATPTSPLPSTCLPSQFGSAI
jgi:hypothetical protein